MTLPHESTEALIDVAVDLVELLGCVAGLREVIQERLFA